jgi:hypothetical protein
MIQMAKPEDTYIYTLAARFRYTVRRNSPCSTAYGSTGNVGGAVGTGEGGEGDGESVFLSVISIC